MPDDAGDSWTNNHCSRLFLGDCLKTLACLPDHSIDCIITDPHYDFHNQGRSHALTLDQTAHDDEGTYELLDQVLAAAWHKLKENSHIYIFTSWREFSPMAAVVKKYFNLKNALIWVKHNRTRSNLKGNYSNQYEIILYAHKGRRYLSGKRDANILYFNKVPSTHMRHPTEKPVALIEYLLSKSTGEGETVLDMFMGVGTTCMAAQRTNRRYIGIELEPAWFALASQWLKDRLEGGVA